MVAFDGDRGCEEAAAYYHDFLLDPSDPSIPASVIGHIGRCEHCRGQVHHWEAVLAQTEGVSAPAADKDLIAELQRHFEFVGRPVRCGQVKPFLPSLLIPTLKIRIPTPITVHVDHCAECAADLAVLRGLGLDSDQLCRLSQFYAQISAADSRACPEALSTGPVRESPRPEGVADEFRLDRQREQSDTGDVCDREVSTADFFDFVIPDGPGRANARPQALEVHLRSCPRCLQELRALHDAVCGVADRADSDVATVYTTRPLDQEAPEEADGLYAGHAIDVEVIRPECGPVGRHLVWATRIGAVLRRGVSNPVLRPFVRTAFLVAAMIPLAVVFWMTTPSASGLSVRQVNDMVQAAPAVHMVTSFADGITPPREVWVSTARGLFITKTRAETVAYRVDDNQGIVITSNEAGVETSDLTGMERANLKQVIRVSLEFSLAEVPPGGELTRVVAADGDAASEVTEEAYELVWSTLASNRNAEFRRWVVYVDSSTQRPLRWEFYSRETERVPWELSTKAKYDYPNPDEIQARWEALLPLP